MESESGASLVNGEIDWMSSIIMWDFVMFEQARE